MPIPTEENCPLESDGGNAGMRVNSTFGPNGLQPVITPTSIINSTVGYETGPEIGGYSLQCLSFVHQSASTRYTVQR